MGGAPSVQREYAVPAPTVYVIETTEVGRLTPPLSREGVRSGPKTQDWWVNRNQRAAQFVPIEGEPRTLRYLRREKFMDPVGMDNMHRAANFQIQAEQYMSPEERYVRALERRAKFY